jgi:hypothetical protein
MPAPDYTPKLPMTEAQREHLRSVVTRPVTLDDVLYGIQVLADKVERLEAVIAPRRSPLALDADDIARTMAMLRSARPVHAKKETPP